MLYASQYPFLHDILSGSNGGFSCQTSYDSSLAGARPSQYVGSISGFALDPNPANMSTASLQVRLFVFTGLSAAQPW